MPSDFPAQTVLARLGWGRDNARFLSDIAEDLGWPRRAVEAAVQALRMHGKAIASDGSGVWLTGDAAELEATFASMRRRIRSQMVTAWAVRSTARRMRGAGEQLPLFKEGEAA